MTLRPAFGFRAGLAQRELEYSMKTDEFEMPPMECRWGVRAQLNSYCWIISHAMRAPCGCRGGSKPRIVLGVEFLVSR